MNNFGIQFNCKVEGKKQTFTMSKHELGEQWSMNFLKMKIKERANALFLLAGSLTCGASRFFT